jgi:hypothetical protein
MLNKGGYPCLIHDFRENAFSFSPLSMMLAIGLFNIAFRMLNCILSSPSFIRVFIMKGCRILSKVFSVSTEKILWFFCLLLLIYFRLFKLFFVLYFWNFDCNMDKFFSGHIFWDSICLLYMYAHVFPKMREVFCCYFIE